MIERATYARFTLQKNFLFDDASKLEPRLFVRLVDLDFPPNGFSPCMRFF